MVRGLLASLGLVFVFLATGCDLPHFTEQTMVERGYALFQTKDNEGARKMFTMAVEQFPERPQPWIGLGLVELREQHWDAAEAAGNKAIDAYWQNPPRITRSPDRSESTSTVLARIYGYIQGDKGFKSGLGYPDGVLGSAYLLRGRARLGRIKDSPYPDTRQLKEISNDFQKALERNQRNHLAQESNSIVTTWAEELGKWTESEDEEKSSLPSFLPDYFAPLLGQDEESLRMVRRTKLEEKDGGVGEAALYSSPDNSSFLFVQKPQGDPIPYGLFGPLLPNAELIQRRKMAVETVKEDAYSRWMEGSLGGLNWRHVTFYTPGGTYMFETFARGGSPVDKAGHPDQLDPQINQLIYQEAVADSGRDSLRAWEPRIKDHARRLLEAGDTGGGLQVYQDLARAQAADIDSQLQIAKLTGDSETRQRKAEIVMRNSTDSRQILEAAKLLGTAPRSLDSLPVLTEDQRGLKVVLLAIPPCDPYMLEEVGELFEKSFDIPVEIFRLSEEWTWGEPDRLAGVVDAQRMLQRNGDNLLNQDGWTTDMYAKAMNRISREADTREDRLEARRIEDDIKSKPGQYCAEKALQKLGSMVARFRADDPTTMFVGVTEADLYVDDLRYVFSLVEAGPEARGILSYAQLKYAAESTPYNTRPEVVEQLAKEMVPPSLFQLEIPRSDDPSCPYSRANGLADVNQKTLVLSNQVQEVIEKVKNKKSPE